MSAFWILITLYNRLYLSRTIILTFCFDTKYSLVQIKRLPFHINFNRCDIRKMFCDQSLIRLGKFLDSPVKLSKFMTEFQVRKQKEEPLTI